MKRWLVVALLGALAVASAAAYLWWTRGPGGPPPVVRSLPDEAEDVHWKELDMFPDWGFLMSARLAEEECRAFIREELSDLEPYDAAAVERMGGERSIFASWISLHESEVEDGTWWDPEPLRENTTWIQSYSDGGSWAIAQCTKGRVYFQESSN